MVEGGKGEGEELVAVWDVTQLGMSGQVCADCGEEIGILEEALCLQVAYPVTKDQWIEAEGNEGEYLYTPHFFHVACWADEIDHPLEELLTQEEMEPVLHGDGVVECECCTSDILSWELSGLLELGEFQQSERGEREIVFVPYEGSRKIAICISCLHTINEDLLELWEEGVTYGGCCSLGLELRCWRTGVCNDPGGPECRLYNEL